MSFPASPPDKPEAGLGRRAARGGFVTYTGQGARILLQLTSVVVLTRLLDPRDYGLLAMVLAVVGVGEIFRDFGLSSAAVQAKTLSDQQRTNLFWVNTVIGVILAALVFSLSGLLAHLYGRPELIPIAQALSLTFLMNGLATQFRANLNRSLRFAKLAAADIAAPAVGLVVAVAAALSGWHYWALVAQQLTQSFVLLMILSSVSHWRPGLPRRNSDMRGLLRFGWHLVGTQLIGYVSNNLDSVVIGTQFGATSLGIYNRSYQLLMSPLSQLRAPTTTVALPILAQLVDDDDRYGRFITRGQLVLGYSLVAGLGVVVGAAEPLTLVLLGDKWLEVAPILRILAIAGIFQTLAYVGYWVYLSRGLTADLLRYTLVTSAIRATCILVGSMWGVVGVAVGYAVAPAIAWPISLLWLSRRTRIPLRGMLLGALRILVLTALVGVSTLGAVLLTADLDPLIQVCAAFIAALLVYALASVSIPFFRRDAQGIIETLKLIPQSRRAR